MTSIKVNILGKQYPLRVEDSEVESMQRIARFVDERFREYKKELKQQPETTVMVLACLSIAEELFEERDKNHSNGQQKRLLNHLHNNLEEILEDLKES